MDVDEIKKYNDDININDMDVTDIDTNANDMEINSDIEIIDMDMTDS
jgi:hypothetical protein